MAGKRVANKLLKKGSKKRAGKITDDTINALRRDISSAKDIMENSSKNLKNKARDTGVLNSRQNVEIKENSIKESMSYGRADMNREMLSNAKSKAYRESIKNSNAKNYSNAKQEAVAKMKTDIKSRKETEILKSRDLSDIKNSEINRDRIIKTNKEINSIEAKHNPDNIARANVYKNAIKDHKERTKLIRESPRKGAIGRIERPDPKSKIVKKNSPVEKPKNKIEKGISNAMPYAVGGGLLFAMANRGGQQTNAELYGQQRPYGY